MSAPAARLAAITAILLVSTAAVGHAQLGGLLKKGKDAAAGKAGETAAAQVPPKTVDVLPCDVTYAQLEALERGLEAELKAAPAAEKEAESRQAAVESERKAYDKAMDTYRTKQEAYSSCRERVNSDPATKKKLAELEAKGEAEQKKAEAAVDEKAIEAQMKQVQAAAERIANGKGTAADQKTMADFQAQMGTIQQASTSAMATSAEATKLTQAQAEQLKKCGEEPEQPKNPSYMGWSPERVLLETGAKAAGMSPGAYQVVRDCAIKSANLRLSDKNPDADKTNAKLTEIQQTLKSMRSARVPI